LSDRHGRWGLDDYFLLFRYTTERKGNSAQAPQELDLARKCASVPEFDSSFRPFLATRPNSND